MPQPLKTKLTKNPHMAFYTTNGLSNRPKLAQAFAECMEEFTVAEGTIGAVYLVLNATRPTEAYVELEENVTFSSRIKLVEKCAVHLNAEDKALVLAVTKRASSAAKLRNKIAHCRWGFSDDLPDAVLCTPIGISLKDLRERLKQNIKLPAQRINAEEGVMVYEKADFDQIYTAALNAAAPLSILCNYVMWTDENKPYAKAQILSDPETDRLYKKFLG